MARLSGKLLRIRWREFGREHGLPLLFFGLLSIAVTWPTVLNFTTRLVSNGGDARNNLWMLWHVKEALLGSQPWFDLDLLYYPAGVNLLTRGLGPLVGLLALPFWPLGPEAAYNGAMILTFWSTGYTMYLLARELNFDRKISLFAGLFLILSPIHLAGIEGHMTKTFMAMLPLVFLAFIRLLDLERSWWWAVTTAVFLLLTLLHNGYQFIFAVMAIAFFGVAAYLRAEAAEKRPILLRGMMLAVMTTIIVGPLLAAIHSASADPLVQVDANVQSINFQPDTTEFFLPPAHSILFGNSVRSFLLAQGHKPAIETAVSLSYTGIFLYVLAALRAKRESRLWWVFGFLIAVLAVGPSIKFLGERTFTEYRFPIIMPYAFLTALPGFDFMRASGRFMMVGYVALGITASYGLMWLCGRYPRYGRQIVLLAAALLIVEWWPQSWSQQRLRPVPVFYEQIAADPAIYGVFDLPVKPADDTNQVGYSTSYQRYQLVHEKGIASGYLARTYQFHPLFPCLIPNTRAPEPDVQLNGEPADCADNFLFDLANFNYRYVVLHHPQPGDWYDEPDSWGQAEAADLLDRFFGEQTPMMEDNLATVYQVPQIGEITGLEPTIGLADNWYDAEAEWRWASSPATLFLSIPEAQNVVLEMVPTFIYEPDAAIGMGQEGQMIVSLDNGYSTTVTVRSGEKTAVSLTLEAGVYHITLELEAGNFRPTDFDGQDGRLLSFALHRINLVTDAQAVQTR